jgi:ribosomal-protein-serine acetyltransferase
MTTSPKLSLRPLQLSDIPQLYNAVMESRAFLAPWLPWCGPLYCIDDSRVWVETQIKAFAAGDEYVFAIIDEEGVFSGACGLNHLDKPNRRANLGYWMRVSRLGRGYAAEATRQLAAWAFANTELVRLEIVASLENRRSVRTAEKAGAQREGTLRKRLLLQGRHHDCALFSLVRPD